MVKLKVGSPNRGATVDTSSISPDLSHYLRDDEAIDTGVANGTNTITGLATVFDAGTTKAINIAPGTDNRAGIFEIRDDQNNYVSLASNASQFVSQPASGSSAGIIAGAEIAASGIEITKYSSDYTETSRITLAPYLTNTVHANPNISLLAEKPDSTPVTVGLACTADGNGALSSSVDFTIYAPTLTVPAITSSSADTCAATKKYVDDAVAGASGGVTKYSLSVFTDYGAPSWTSSSDNPDYPYQASILFMLPAGETANGSTDIMQLYGVTLNTAQKKGDISPYIYYYSTTISGNDGYYAVVYSKDNTIGSMNFWKLKVIK